MLQQVPILHYPSQSGAINEEAPEHAGVKLPESVHKLIHGRQKTYKHDEGPCEDLPDRSVGIPSCVESERSPVRHLRLRTRIRGCAVARNDFRRLAVFDMHALLVKLLVLSSTFLVLDAGLGQDLGRHRGPNICCLGYKKEDADAEDAKEDGTHAESPFVAKIFDDVAGDEASTSDTAEEEEIPYSDTSASLVNKVQVTDRSLDQDFVWCHADATKDTAA